MSRTEGVPVYEGLQFVYGTPKGKATNEPTVRDNPYARRETRTRAQREDSDTDGEERSKTSRDVAVGDRIPEVCPHWLVSGGRCDDRNSSMPHRRCRFMHAREDENGRPYKEGNFGKLQPKYRIPPLTCLYWLTGDNGCKKPPEDCDFAHRNTGYVPKNLGDDTPFEIDPNRAPECKEIWKEPPLVGGNNKTCWYFANGGCSKSAHQCLFKHYDTGVIADRFVKSARTEDAQGKVTGANSFPVGSRTPNADQTNNRPDQSSTTTTPAIDKRGQDLPHAFTGLQHTYEEQRERRRNVPSSELTCWFWANGDHCVKSIGECKYQHRHTGTVADPPRGFRAPWEAQNNPLRRSSYHDDNGFDSIPTVPTRTSRGVPPPSGSEVVAMGSNAIATTTATTTRRASALGIEPCLDKMAVSETGPRLITDRTKEIAKPPTITPIEKNIAVITCSEFRSKIDQVCKLDFASMFSNQGVQDANAMLDPRAFLIYHPEEHMEELEVLTRWLLMHKVEVSSARHEGGWDHFRQKLMMGNSGVVIAHPDVEVFDKLPGIGALLQKSVRLWAVGMQESINHHTGLSNIQLSMNYSRFEIFPSGGFVYITDEVFETEPRLALEMVQLFCKRVRALQNIAGLGSMDIEADSISLPWRLCTRPALFDYIIEYCTAHTDPVYECLAQIGVILNEDKSIEGPNDLVNTTEINHPLLSVRRYPVLSVNSRTLDQPTSGFQTKLKVSRDDANLHMIRYYNALACKLRRFYRHFYVVHTDPEAACVQMWKEELQTISEVIPPRRFVEELYKKDQNSMIDFHEKEIADWKNGK